MKKTAARRMMITLGVTGIVVPLMAWALLSDPYRWLTTRQWLAMLQSGGFRANHAAIAIRRTPKEQLFPVIREWMTLTNATEEWQPHFLSRFSIIPALPPERKRFAAHYAVALLGPEAKPLVAELQATLLQPSSPATFDAVFALLTIGPEGQATISKVTSAHSEPAQIAKAAIADMLTQPAVTAALQNWAGQTAEDVNRLRCIFNLKCLLAKFRMHAASRGPESSPGSATTNGLPRGRRPRPVQPLP